MRGKRTLRKLKPDTAQLSNGDRAQFSRESPAERRRHLGEAVLRCILKHGHAGISVRQVAKEAGVSLGLIRHHFGEFDELVTHAFDMTTDTLFDAIGKAIDRSDPTPQARLDVFIETSFSPLLLDRNVLGVWVVFWGLILHSRRMGRAQQREYTLYLRMVEGLLRDLAAAEKIPVRDIRLASVSFTALLDGLWLAWCLNPTAFKATEGAAICRVWVEGLRRGVFA
jgi:TetR/AcrR family transcriptional regulator, transcriptional repressor of bet genes